MPDCSEPRRQQERQPSDPLRDLRSLLPEELQAEVAELQLPAYRVKQLFDWLQRRGAPCAAEMTNLPKELRRLLDKQHLITRCNMVRRQESADGTRKYLFRLYDGQTVESVVMRYTHGLSICISSQVGCKMGCAFCASGALGWSRDLLPGELIAQIQAAQNDMGAAISHVVLMGMGEPLDNFTHVLRFLQLVSHPEGLHISQRKISVSTCGLVPQIGKLAKEHLGLTLSVSLHAPEDALRSRLMPVNRKWPLNELLQACKEYTEATARRISFEYALFDGINDSAGHAKALAKRLKGMLCHVNLIPANPVPGTEFRRAKPEAIRAFQSILEQHGIAVTVRRSLGKEIDAACGQLKLQALDIRQ